MRWILQCVFERVHQGHKSQRHGSNNSSSNGRRLPPFHHTCPHLGVHLRHHSRPQFGACRLARARMNSWISYDGTPALLAEVKRRGIGGPRQPSTRRSSTPEELSLPITLLTKRRTVHEFALVDSGANQNLMDAGFARAHRLGVRRVQNACRMYNIDGTLHAKSGTHYVDLEIATNAQTHVCRFLLMDLSDDVIILGFPWLCKFEPQISWHNAHFGLEYSDVRFKTIPPRPRSDAGPIFFKCSLAASFAT
jgi:hypothetical protein